MTMRAVVILSAAIILAACSDRQAAMRPSNAYTELAALPDWSGAWAVDFNYSHTVEYTEIPQFKDAELLARYSEEQAIAAKGGDNIARAAQSGANSSPRPRAGSFGSICIGGGGGNPTTFNGVMGGAGPSGLLEILFTPGRVTIASDSGWVRRIYTDGRALPEDPFLSRTGMSVGHWEGDTLVVQTVGLDPATRITGGVRAGAGFKIRERIRLAMPGVLAIETTIEAPEVYGAPFTFTRRWVRNDVPDVTIAEYLSACDSTDRSIDPVLQRQTFDLTPPADLPPPPSN